MRIEKEKIITSMQLEKIECDWCKNEIKHDSSYDVFECTIQLKTGECYPEGGQGDILSSDLCQECSKLLINQLKAIGIRINESEWDF